MNFYKSEMFVSPNMRRADVGSLSRIFGVKCVEKPGVYLGSNWILLEARAAFSPKFWIPSIIS